MTGKLLKVVSGFCYVECDGTVYECKPRGNLKKQLKLIAGDEVEISVIGDGKAVIDKALPRASFFVRPPVANVNRLVIVSAQNTPSPNALLIDRLCAIAQCKGVQPIVVFNKCDCGDLSAWVDIYRNAGIVSFAVSAFLPETLVELRSLVADSEGITVFTGNSGVGKSSLLNAMFPDFSLETGEVSKKLGRGRHTTRVAQLFALSGGGYVADTPGFSSLDIQKFEMLYRDDLQDGFSEFSPYLGKCRFTSCTHTCEKDCAVIAAVQDGKIQKSRYESYKQIYNEIKDIKEWQIKGK